ncbi:MAG: peroxiredoxin [Patescibacteria group bacterium]
MLKAGTSAPEIVAPDQNGITHKLSDYQGKWVLLYFYPRDNTPGCTTEACALRDNYPHFTKTETVILGVSTDSVASHEKFVQKFGLPFTLLSDNDKKIVKAYGANGLVRRISYLIDPAGKIAKVYEKVKPAEHAEEVLRDVAIMKQ